MGKLQTRKCVVPLLISGSLQDFELVASIFLSCIFSCFQNQPRVFRCFTVCLVRRILHHHSEEPSPPASTGAGFGALGISFIKWPVNYLTGFWRKEKLLLTNSFGALK